MAEDSIIYEAVEKFGARAVLMAMAAEADEYAGIPMPIGGESMVIHPKYRFAEIFKKKEESSSGEADDEPASDAKEINAWYSVRRRGTVVIFTENGKRQWGLIPPVNRALVALHLPGLAGAWDLGAEAKAIQKLASLLKNHAFMGYMMTGSFLETSKRSGVTYLFRRLRPTLAISTRTGDARVLCGLCLHPIGYYAGTWGGAMVPTDEVIAHLMLMRGDEHDFWKQANQHPAWMPESGL